MVMTLMVMVGLLSGLGHGTASLDALTPGFGGVHTGPGTTLGGLTLT